MQYDRSRIWAFHGVLFILTLVSFRHFFYEGDHLWTGEGSRLSWSMRLKGKFCDFAVQVADGEWKYPDFSGLSPMQNTNMEDPYFFLTFAKARYCGQGDRVYGKVVCRAISRKPTALIHPEVDLCKLHFNFFTHNDWIYPFPGELDPNYRIWFENSKRTHLQK